jgi:hypothetical protein
MLSLRPSPLSILILAAVVAVKSAHLRADDALSDQPRKLLGESDGRPIARACILPNCATVLAIRHRDMHESPPSTPVQGALKRNPPFGPTNPHVPPINQPSFMVQKQMDIWMIEVQRRDGTVQVIRQDYAPLFQVGDEVVVERERVRAPE